METKLPEVAPGKTHLVGRYFTPLALMIVVNGIILTRPPSPIKEISIGLLIFSVLFNQFSIKWIDAGIGAGGWRLSARVIVNVIVNIGFIFLLGAYWKPIWLLLLLTPVATAIYGSRTQTIFYAGLAMTVLIVFHSTRAHISPVEWAEQVTYGLFIMLLSLAIFQISPTKRAIAEE